MYLSTLTMIVVFKIIITKYLRLIDIVNELVWQKC